MTRADVARGAGEAAQAIPAPLSAPDGAWVDFLKQRLLAGWRSDEWDEATLQFLGNPENPMTRVNRCITPQCRYLTDLFGRGRCVSCRTLWAKAEGNEQRFAELVKNRRRFLEAPLDTEETCRVHRGGQHCGRVPIANGVCSSHDTLWRGNYQPHSVSLDEFIAAERWTLYEPRPACAVDNCERQQAVDVIPLCVAHRYRYERHRKANSLPRGSRADALSFAATEAPVLPRGSFSLQALPDHLKYEFLAALQANDADGHVLDPPLIRRVLLSLDGLKGSLGDPDFYSGEFVHARESIPNDQSLFIRRAMLTVGHLRMQFDGVDATAGDLWDSSLTGLRTTTARARRVQSINEPKFKTLRSLIDFSPIRQVWLREVVKEWARDLRPETGVVSTTIKAATILSEAIALRPHPDDPSKAGARDVQKALELAQLQRKPDGTAYSMHYASGVLTSLRRLLYYARNASLLDGVPLGFIVTPDHVLRKTKSVKERAGLALPNRVVSALSNAVRNLDGCPVPSGAQLPQSDLDRMYQTALRVLIDTGRRPGEVCTLQVGCVTRITDATGKDAEYQLRWDNHKSGRDNRDLPINSDTAHAILEWEAYRKTLNLPTDFDVWLFPAPSAGRHGIYGPMSTGVLNRAVKRLVKSVPLLESDTPDRASGGFLGFTGQVLPYSFRHSYAQRHADAGVDVETLRDLMDHKSLMTTLGYYTVSAKRKREAVKRVSGLSVDRRGEDAPQQSPAAYSVSSVAVPFGNCTEPTNVQAGGRSCAIRFRCTGCDMFRPDPSFLPSIRDHLTSLRGNLALVELSGSVAEWVLFEMRQEIESYEQIVKGLENKLEGMDPGERAAVDDASIALRRVRAQRPMLPLTVKKYD